MSRLRDNPSLQTARASPVLEGADTKSMTLGRLSLLLTFGLTLAVLIGFMSTGSILLAFSLLATPLPAGAVYWWFPDRADWTLHEFLNRGPDPIGADLDDALRPPVPTPSHADGGYFVPGVPMLSPRAALPAPPPPCDSSPLVSSPPSPPARQRST